MKIDNDPQSVFRSCLNTVEEKKWGSLFKVRLELQRMIDQLLPEAKNLTDTQKLQINGDAYFLLIGLSSAENVH